MTAPPVATKAKMARKNSTSAQTPTQRMKMATAITATTAGTAPPVTVSWKREMKRMKTTSRTRPGTGVQAETAQRCFQPQSKSLSAARSIGGSTPSRSGSTLDLCRRRGGYQSPAGGASTPPGTPPADWRREDADEDDERETAVSAYSTEAGGCWLTNLHKSLGEDKLTNLLKECEGKSFKLAKADYPEFVKAIESAFGGLSHFQRPSDPNARSRRDQSRVQVHRSVLQ
mmetsp:Transcript_24487/g.55445  ORF Transcript_24487/g.55445 Transcript_24487/m.55445 type:complete len:229 (+) Transcript_24487:204-890(+)